MVDIEQVRDGWRRGLVTDREILDALTTAVEQMQFALALAEDELREVVTTIQARRTVE